MNIAYNFITSDTQIRDRLRNSLKIAEYLNPRALLLINFTTAMAISAANPNGATLFQFISERLLDPTNHIIFAYDQGDNNKIIGLIIFKIEPSSINVIFHRCIVTTREYDEICNILMSYLEKLARLMELRGVVVGDQPPRLLGPGGSMLGGKKALKARKVKRSRHSRRSIHSRRSRKMIRRRGGTRKSE